MMKTVMCSALAFGACAIAVVSWIETSSAWAGQPQQVEAAPDSGTDKPMALSEAEMAKVTAGAPVAVPAYEDYHLKSKTGESRSFPIFKANELDPS